MVSTSSTTESAEGSTTDSAAGSTTEGAAGSTTESCTVINPATARAVTEVHLTTVEETDAAIERAREAFSSWRAMAPGERATLLRRFAAVVDDHVDELAELEVRNAGHTWGNARWADDTIGPISEVSSEGSRTRSACTDFSRPARNSS